jgi:hypothetical protein
MPLLDDRPIIGLFFITSYLRGLLVPAWLRSLGQELTASLSDGGVWAAILAALFLGLACLVLGSWIARRVGIINLDSPAGETLGVGLGTGLLVVAATWATLGSTGRSCFVPVAVTLVTSGILGVRTSRAHAGAASPAIPTRHLPRRPIVKAAALGAAFIVSAGLFFGSTVAPSPRGGVQPVAYQDHAYYAALAQGLSRTGAESLWYPSGLDDVQSVPKQAWYHWGEIWLASAVQRIGIDPLFARYYVVLPLVLLAAVTLAGSLVRRLTLSRSRMRFLFGASACLLFAPTPLPYKPPFFGGWFGAHVPSLIYEITHYGLAASTLLLAVFIILTLGSRATPWSAALFAGGVFASLLPVHLIVALVVAASAGVIASFHWALSLLRDKRMPVVPSIWRRTLLVAGVVTTATMCWGAATGHELGGPSVPGGWSSFDPTWAKSVVWTLLPGGALLLIPVAWFLIRKEAGMRPWLFLGTAVSVVVGAIAWGIRSGDFVQFYFFFFSILLAVPTFAAAAVWIIRERLRHDGHTLMAAGVLALLAIQIVLGGAAGLERLEVHRQDGYSYDQDLLSAIDELPTDAKLAYSCTEADGDMGFWVPRQLGITTLTGRRVVPMCFPGESSNVLLYHWEWAPQHSLYPDPGTRPSAAAVLAFLKSQQIDYIFTDSKHPNELLPEGQAVAVVGDASIIRVP